LEDTARCLSVRGALVSANSQNFGLVHLRKPATNFSQQQAHFLSFNYY
jgi:hypothetical protein